MKTYWSVGTTILTLIVGYLVFPLSAEVDENSEKINDLRTRMAVQESMIQDMDEKLDEIQIDIKELLRK